MKKTVAAVLLILIIAAFTFVSCSDSKDSKATTKADETKKSAVTTVADEDETTEKDEKDTDNKSETTSEKKAETTSKKASTETEKAKATDKSTASSQAKETIPQYKETVPAKDSYTADGNVPCPQASGTKDAFGGYQYVYTKSGKKLVHTYADRAVASEDNSNTLSYMPMLSTTNTPNTGASYNNPKALLKDTVPGYSAEGVMVGYDGYFFYQDTINDFIGEGFLHNEIYDRAVSLLTSYSKFAKQHGMKFYLVIAPNKNSVYPDYMPEGYKMASYRRYDQFIEIVNKSGITAVDLRGAMSAAVKANPSMNLYYKYDTHWNNHAGFIAYQTTMNMIKKDFPNVVVHSKNEYQINYCETYMKDMAYYLGFYSYFKDYGPVYTLKSGKTARLINRRNEDGTGQYLFAYECTSGANSGYSDKLHYYKYQNDYNTSAPSIYILRDSYSIAMAPFLKDSFYQSTYNWTFSFNSAQQDILDSDADIILMVVAERNLRNMVNCKVVND